MAVLGNGLELRTRAHLERGRDIFTRGYTESGTRFLEGVDEEEGVLACELVTGHVETIGVDESRREKIGLPIDLE